MNRLKNPALVLVSACAIALAGCGGGGSDADSSAPTTAATSADSPAADATSPSPDAAADAPGTLSDSAFATAFKQAIPAIAEKSDDEVATAAKGACTTFKANPTKEGAQAVHSDIASALGVDDTSARILASGAITNYCADQGEAYMMAAIG